MQLDIVLVNKELSEEENSFKLKSPNINILSIEKLITRFSTISQCFFIQIKMRIQGNINTSKEEVADIGII